MTTLYPYQREGAKWLAQRPRRILADQQRVGKTPAMIRAFDLRGSKRICWLTRGAAKFSHAAMFQEFQQFDRPITVFEESRDRFGDGVNILSHDMAAKLRDRVMAEEFDAFGVDEFHRMRNREAARTKAVYGDDCDGKDGFVSRAETIYFGSGTPTPNFCDGLWPLLRAVFPDKIIGSNGKPMNYWSFTNKMCKTRDNGFGVEIVGHKTNNVAALRASLNDILLRRTHAEVNPDAPPISYRDLPVPGERLPELVELERDGLLDEVATKLARARDDDARMSILKRVDAQVRARLSRLTGLAKVEGVCDLVEEEFDEGMEKIVLFAWHRDVIDALVRRLSRFNPVFLLGGSSGLSKEKTRQAFQNERSVKVFVGQIEAAGEAIDLSAAKDIIFVESDWVPGNNAQASFRCTHPSKKQSVLVRFASIEGSRIDTQKQAVLRRKTEAIGQLFN